MVISTFQNTWRRSRGRNVPRGEQLKNQYYLISESLISGLKQMTMDLNIPEIVVIIVRKYETNSYNIHENLT